MDETSTGRPAEHSQDARSGWAAPDPQATRAVPAPDVQGQDEVDRLVADWRSERPDLDVTPLTVLSRLTRLAKHLDRARRSAFAENELEQWEFDVLAALRRSGQPYELSPGQLVTQAIVTSGTMTNRVDRLATKGLVQRRPDPDDRRGVLVALTDAGRQRADGALDGLIAREHELLAELGDADRLELARLLRELLLPFESRATAPDH